jgi:hypothetical protein
MESKLKRRKSHQSIPEFITLLMNKIDLNKTPRFMSKKKDKTERKNDAFGNLFLTRTMEEESDAS